MDRRRSFGRARATYGSKVPMLEPVASVPVDYANFSAGLDLRDAGDKLDPAATQDALDTEVDERNRLVRVPGTVAVETFSGRAPVQMVTQTTLDRSAELVIFDPPWIGVKGSGDTVWHYASIPSGYPVYATTNYGGTLLFSNGKQGLYKREPRSATVALVPGAPAAKALAITAARVFAANCVIDQELEPLGVRWTAANSNYDDWHGLGSGMELLIDDSSGGDQIVAVVPMSLDFTAFVMQRNLWVGTRTNLTNRPVDFKPRVAGIGFLSAQACTITPLGLIGIGEAGIYLFNGNAIENIGEQIESAVLPVQKDNIGKYSVKYDWDSKRVFVLTPTDTWIFDLYRRRWSRRSLLAASMELFAPQMLPTTWENVAALTWSGLGDAAWQDYNPTQGIPATRHYLVRVGSNTALATESYEVDTNVGVPLQPHYQLSSQLGAGARTLVTIQEVLIRYFGSGTVDLECMDQRGVFRLVGRATITEYSEYGDVFPVARLFTGRNAVVRLRILSSTLRIVSVHLRVLPRSQRIWGQG
jgi:hypothetical protein